MPSVLPPPVQNQEETEAGFLGRGRGAGWKPGAKGLRGLPLCPGQPGLLAHGATRDLLQRPVGPH